MKKTVCIVLALLLVLTMLSGCVMVAGVEDEKIPEVTASIPEEDTEEQAAADDFYTHLEEIPTFTDIGVTLESRQGFLYNVNTGEMLAMKGAGEQLYPASLTKLLSILTAFDYIDPDTEITVGNEITLIGDDSSVAWVGQGQVLTAEELAAGMLIPSGNDAAYVLAAAVGRLQLGEEGEDLLGTEVVDEMLPLMQAKAAELGMEHSSIHNVDGFLDLQHYSTVEDMARLAIAAYSNSIIRKYCGMEELEAPDVVGDFYWTNTNLMLDPDSDWYSPYVKGMKTGSVDGSYCMVGILEYNGETYLAGVFTGSDKEIRYRDMNAIMTVLFGGTGHTASVAPTTDTTDTASEA